jgi:ribonuclease VapC
MYGSLWLMYIDHIEMSMPSALMVITLEAPDWQDITWLIATATGVFISATALTETLIVTRVKRGARARSLVNHTVQLWRFEVAPVDAAMAQLAFDAFEIYGKGSGHTAQLNFGDTFSYALAKIKNVPLLFKGNAFSRTDVRGCIATTQA